MMTRKLAALMRMMIWSKVIVMMGVCCWGQKRLLTTFPQQGLELRILHLGQRTGLAFNGIALLFTWHGVFSWKKG